MKAAPTEVTELNLQDQVELIEKYKQEHPELADALRIFEISSEAYEQAVRAMYGDQVSWSTAVNPSLPTA